MIGLRKDGSMFPLELSVSEMHLGPNRLFTGILRHHTRNSGAEEELRHLNETLERIVQQRTEMLGLLHEATSA